LTVKKTPLLSKAVEYRIILKLHALSLYLLKVRFVVRENKKICLSILSLPLPIQILQTQYF
jgi:hypothetical protein